MFEVITGPSPTRFHPETVRRTPWTRRFFSRRTTGPRGETIRDLVEWTRQNWPNLVLKPERGYSGIGVKVGAAGQDGDDAIETALIEGGYIVQEKIALSLWGEAMPEIDRNREQIIVKNRQTDFRCLIGPDQVFGFLCRFGDVPTNVGSGGGVQPLAILKSPMSVREAVDRINDTIARMDYGDLLSIEDDAERFGTEGKIHLPTGADQDCPAAPHRYGATAGRPGSILPGHVGGQYQTGKDVACRRTG